MNANLDVLATAHCGCRVQRPVGTAIIQLAMCPLHEAAPQLLEALHKIAHGTSDGFLYSSVINEIATVAIAAAEEA